MNNNLEDNWHTQELLLNFEASSVRLVVELMCNEFETMWVDDVSISAETFVPCPNDGVFSQDFDKEAVRPLFGYDISALGDLTGSVPYRLPNMPRSTLVASTEISTSNCQLGFSLWWDPKQNTALGTCDECRGLVEVPSGMDRAGEQAYVLARPYNKEAGQTGATFELRFDVISAANKAVDISLDIYLYSLEDTWEDSDNVRVFIVIDGNRDDPYVLFEEFGGDNDFELKDNQWTTLNEVIQFQTSSVQLVVELTSSHELERVYVDNVVITLSDPQPACNGDNYYQNFESIRPSGDLHSYSGTSTLMPISLPNVNDQPTVSAPSSGCLLGFDLLWNSEGAPSLAAAQRGVVREVDLSSQNGDNLFAMAKSRGPDDASLILQFANITTEWQRTQVQLDLYFRSVGSEFWEGGDFVTVSVAYVDGSGVLQTVNLFDRGGVYINQNFNDQWVAVSRTIETYTSSVQLTVEASTSAPGEILYVDGVIIESREIGASD